MTTPSPKTMPSRSEITIFIVGLLISLGVAGAGIYYFEPRLFGAPADLQVVQLDEKLSPFFEGIFREKDLRSTEFFRPDPITVVRGLPFLAPIQGVGPHDAFGFRNRSIPYRARVITIGDSQTYGINVPVGNTWPSALQNSICQGDCPVYNMSLGSWAAPQYLYATQKSAAFRPAHVIVAIYTGNDALETFRTAYSVNFWKALRLNKDLTLKDLPKIQFPPDPKNLWTTTLSGQKQMTFAPELRLSAVSLEDPVVSTAYQIIEKTLEEMSAATKRYGAELSLVVIPTKELVYAKRIERDGVSPPESYSRLVLQETARIEQLMSFANATGIHTIELLKPFQEAALTSDSLYPADSNGHPLAAGYSLVGNQVATHLQDKLLTPVEGLYLVEPGPSQSWYFLYRNKQLRKFASAEILTRCGWKKEDASKVEFEEIAFLRPGAEITTAQKSRFGPR